MDLTTYHMYQEKNEFVKELSGVLTTIPNVETIDYKVFVKHCDTFDKIVEFIVITFKGSGRSPGNVTGNSLSAILRDIAKRIDGGEYEELEYLEFIEKNEEYEELSLDDYENEFVRVTDEEIINKTDKLLKMTIRDPWLIDKHFRIGLKAMTITIGSKQSLKLMTGLMMEFANQICWDNVIYNY